MGPVDHLVLAAINRDENTTTDYDYAPSLDLVTLKLVGYLAVVHALRGRIPPDGSIVLFGGLAKDRPYPAGRAVVEAALKAGYGTRDLSAIADFLRGAP